MARVRMIDEPYHGELAPLADRVRLGRRGAVINIYRALFHSPPLAATWFEHMNAVRWETGLSGRLREILIIRIAHLNQAAYVWRQHVPKLAEPEGLSMADCEALADWRASARFDAAARAALAFADAMTREIVVTGEVHDALRRHYDDRDIVEMAVLIGSYNMNTRVMVALELDLEPQ